MVGLNEAVFFHRASRTLILTDLLFNVPPGSGSILSRSVLWLDGCNGRPAIPRTFRFVISLNRRRARALVDQIFGWDFDRINLTHGNLIEGDGKKVLAEAWAFMLGESAAPR
jgi:hypothetical protein